MLTTPHGAGRTLLHCRMPAGPAFVATKKPRREVPADAPTRHAHSTCLRGAPSRGIRGRRPRVAIRSVFLAAFLTVYTEVQPPSTTRTAPLI